MGKFVREFPDEFKLLLDFTTQISFVKVPASGFRELLCFLYEAAHRYPKCAETLAESLARVLERTDPREFFVLPGGKRAGVAVGVLSASNVPAAGYGFFGWVRLERADQTLPRQEMATVYKLSAHRDCDIGLYIKDGVFYYAVPAVK